MIDIRDHSEESPRWTDFDGFDRFPPVEFCLDLSFLESKQRALHVFENDRARS